MLVRSLLVLALLFSVVEAFSAVTSEVSRSDYVGNGSVAAYATTFVVKATSEVRVFKQDADGQDVELTLGADYSAVLNTAGLCTITLTAGNLTTGYKLSLQRGIPYTQTYNPALSGAYNAANLGAALDRLSMEIIRLKGDVDRAIKVPYLEEGGDTVTKLDDNAAARASQSLVFDASGNAMVGSITSATASVFGQSLIDDTTADAARTTLGLPSQAMTARTVVANDTSGAANGTATLIDNLTVLSDGSVTRRDLSARFSEVFNVKDYGAAGDGVADDTTEINAAVAAAVAVGGRVRFPRGVYLVSSAIIADYSATTGDPVNGTRTRLMMEGDGSGSTYIKATHAGAAFDYRGGTVDGLSSFFSWKGLSLQGPARAAGSIGLKLDNIAYFSFDDFDVSLFEYGVDATDILSGSFSNGEIRLNQYGYRLAYASASRPNAIAFRDVRIASNYTYGGLSTGGAAIIHDGGSVEGNGIGLSLANAAAWGIKAVECGEEGAAGLVTRGTYFEGNNGNADVWIVQTATPVHHDIHGSFVRFLNTQYVTYNVLFDRSGGGAGSRVRVGGGFKALGTYVENIARPYFGGGISYYDEAAGNYYGSSTALTKEVFAASPVPLIPIAFLPTASSFPGGSVLCSDLGGGQDIVISDGTNWKRVNESSQATVATDAIFTVVTLTDAVHTIHTGTLTASRVVTLSSTRAYRGARFKFSRTGAGAFNLDIGGLKNLTTNTWCEVTYNGSAWVLTAYGAL